jgi:intraflagellar transport protein 81
LLRQAALSKLSTLKATVDDTKGKTLTEISRIVSDINQALKDKKNSLAPQV